MKVAKAAHTVFAGYCKALGDYSFKEWDAGTTFAIRCPTALSIRSDFFHLCWIHQYRERDSNPHDLSTTCS